MTCTDDTHGGFIRKPTPPERTKRDNPALGLQPDKRGFTLRRRGNKSAYEME